MDWEVVLTVLGILGAGGVGAVITGFVTARKAGAEIEKIRAEASQQVTAAAISLIEPMKAEIRELRKTIDDYEVERKKDKGRINELECEVERLSDLLEKAGMNPKARIRTKRNDGRVINQ